jgi:salicylate hydroxylase
MALEDGATLAECLERADSSSISKALLTFQQIREPRCKRVQEWATIKGSRATVPDGREQEYCDRNLKQFNCCVKAPSWDKSYFNELSEVGEPDIRLRNG